MINHLQFHWHRSKDVDSRGQDIWWGQVTFWKDSEPIPWSKGYIKYTQSGCDKLDKELVEIDCLEGYFLPIPENPFLKDICKFHVSNQNWNSIIQVTTTDEISQNAVHRVPNALTSHQNDWISIRFICFTHFNPQQEEFGGFKTVV